MPNLQLDRFNLPTCHAVCRNAYLRVRKMTDPALSEDLPGNITHEMFNRRERPLAMRAVRQLREKGLSWAEISRQTNIARSTLRRWGALEDQETES